MVHGVRSFLPLMRAHGEGGHIVNTASFAGFVSGMGFSPYAATKFAVVNMSEGLALQLQPLGIGVSVLCPGFVRTAISDAGRTRHERYGPVPLARSQFAALVAERVQSGLDPAIVAQRVLAAIRDDQPTFHHPEMRERWTSASPRSRRRWTGRPAKHPDCGCVSPPGGEGRVEMRTSATAGMIAGIANQVVGNSMGGADAIRYGSSSRISSSISGALIGTISSASSKPRSAMRCRRSRASALPQISVTLACAGR